MLVKEAPGCVDRLQNLGMIFDQSSDQLATTLKQPILEEESYMLKIVLEEH